MNKNFLWKASNKIIESSNIFKFSKKVENKFNLNFKKNFNSLWNWSLKNNEVFWSELWDFSDIKGDKGKRILDKNKIFYKNIFFPDAKLNFAENLIPLTSKEIAVFSLKENGAEDFITWEELFSNVCKFSDYLIKTNIKKGDVVAAYVPNTIETIVAFLGSTKNGCIWSSCSPDFGPQGVIERFKQIEPKVLITCDHYYYNGKKINILDNVEIITKSIPSIQKVIVFSYDNTKIDKKYLSYYDVLKNSKKDTNFQKFDFNHPVYILYSSGTTGTPKCIVHGSGNALIEQKKELLIHCNVKKNDKVFYYTSTGWMMWNWQVAALSCGASIYLYDGSPLYPEIDILLKYCSQKKFTLFGVGAKYLDHLKNENYNSKHLDLKNLKTICSTGSPLISESFNYVYNYIKKDVHLASISGGTDVVGCLVAGNLYDGVYAGEIQGPSLGLDIDVFDEDGKKLTNNHKGELVVKTPFPSMPIKFWNDNNSEKMHDAYFNKYPNIWYHGDFIQKTLNHGYIIFGRSDATLKPGGVRIGTAEIYRQVENLSEVNEALVVGQNYHDDIRIILFINLKGQNILNSELQEKIKFNIRQNCSPKHVPSIIIECPEIPKTKSGKIVEIAVRKILNGEKINNLEAIANPESLEFFKNLKIN